MAISKAKLKFWASNNYNVCFSGKHGVGKTAQVKELFNELYGELGTDWLYFSASTMDPWVDFVGVPKETVGEDGVAYLTLIRPEVFARDQVKAIFIDEFNRAPKKIRNAIMELLQFSSINGHRFNKLEVIWTAINPPDEDDTYDVDDIDPAQMDRFHIHADIPYDVSKSYFISKYGAEMGEGAIEWWRGLPDSGKKLVSPRRLDYALDCFSKKGDVRDILPEQTNTTKLMSVLYHGPIKKKVNILYSDGDPEKVIEEFKDNNVLDAIIEFVMESDKYLKFFLPLVPSEKLTALFSKRDARTVKRFLNMLSPEDENVSKQIALMISNKTVKGAKYKALTNWFSMVNVAEKNVPVVKGDECFRKILRTCISEVNTENTYHRWLRVENLCNAYNSNKKEFTVDDVKAAYYYIFGAMSRSQYSTMKNVNRAKRVSTLLTGLNAIYSIEAYSKEYDIKEKAYQKMIDANCITQKVISSNSNIELKLDTGNKASIESLAEQFIDEIDEDYPF